MCCWRYCAAAPVTVTVRHPLCCRSEVACCNDGYGDSYNSRYGTGLGDRLTALPSIGSCDWSAMLLAGDLISTGISRIGKASAVCVSVLAHWWAG